MIMVIVFGVSWRFFFCSYYGEMSMLIDINNNCFLGFFMLKFFVCLKLCYGWF